MTREQRQEVYMEMVAMEGANLDSRKIFKDFKAEYKEIMKKVKDNNKAKKFDAAIKECQKVKALTKKTYKKLLDTNGGVDSTILGLFFGEIPFMMRNLIAALLSIPTFNIAYLVNEIAKVVERINVVIKDYKELEKTGIEADDLNMYRNALKVRIAEYDKAIDAVIEKIKAAKKKSNDKK